MVPMEYFSVPAQGNGLYIPDIQRTPSKLTVKRPSLESTDFLRVAMLILEQVGYQDFLEWRSDTSSYKTLIIASENL